MSRRFDNRRSTMFSQFGQAARAVVTLAEQECRNASHYYLGTEHLLLSLAIVTPPDVAARFRQSGLEPWQVKWACRASMEPASEHPWDGVIVTPRVKRIFERAAAACGDRPVAPIDLLDAIVEDGGGVAARVLESFNAREHARTAS
jgi:ATP-dependent Clp protease ATP-binding subunit ClpC